jgi:hypothetical protein
MPKYKLPVGSVAGWGLGFMSPYAESLSVLQRNSCIRSLSNQFTHGRTWKNICLEVYCACRKLQGNPNLRELHLTYIFCGPN